MQSCTAEAIEYVASMSEPQNTLPFPGLNQVKSILAVSSCKGGVGKSTTAVNLAFALSSQGKKVGLLDADVYGPSLPTMVAPAESTLFQENELIIPLEMAGVKLMSFGYLDSGETSGAAILRGPMVSQVVTQLSTRVNWGELDVLVIDFPPGTGDIQLTLTQTLPISGALIVTTPQHLSFVDVVKGIQMFDKLKVPTVGVVENMSYFECSGCSTRHNIFGEGAKRRLVEQFGFKNAYEVPVDPVLCHAGDHGMPLVLNNPADPISRLFDRIATEVYDEMLRLQRDGSGLPVLSYNVGQNCELVFPDGRMEEIEPAALRKACRCARCVNEMTGAPILDPSSVDPDIYPTSVSPVGNYAVALEWSDSHSSIYPYERLIEEFTG